MPNTVNTYCESCMMSFVKDKGQRESEKYCSLCYQNGKLQYEGTDLKEFQKICYQSMRSRGTNFFLAKFYTYMIKFAPRWEK